MTLISSSVNISTPVKNSENARIEGPEHIEILLGLQHDPNTQSHLMFLPVLSLSSNTTIHALSPLAAELCHSDPPCHDRHIYIYIK
ncbi:hypothetical protein K439DRAFT_116493 [Ramaria rubella]|nr:hypothetical protein K439DRAFT_116493 [Ramaria rubella]